MSSVLDKLIDKIPFLPRIFAYFIMIYIPFKILQAWIKVIKNYILMKAGKRYEK